MRYIKTHSVIKLFLVFTLLFSASLNLFSQENNGVNPYIVKSAFMIKICKFTTWQDIENRKNKTFKIYTIGKVPDNGGIFVKKDLLIFNRNIEVINVESINDIKNLEKVDAIFIYEVEEAELENIIELVAEKNILTFSENQGYGDKGVIINFFIRNNKVNFEINRQAELKSKISLNPMLYKLKGCRVIDNQDED